MTDFHHIGKKASRPDSSDKAAGKAHYIHDLQRPGMLYGKIKFSGHPHARIKHIDTSKAERLTGVRAVITANNTPEIRIGFLRDNFALKKDKVRQYRDEVAAVAAIDPEIAKEAVELIQVEYEPLSGVFNPHEAMKKGSPLIHETDAQGRPRTDNLVPLKFHHESGDLEAGKRAAKYSVEGEFSTPMVQQCCMGTRSLFWPSVISTGLCLIWDCTAKTPGSSCPHSVEALGAVSTRMPTNTSLSSWLSKLAAR